MSYEVTRLHGTDVGDAGKAFQTFEDLEAYKAARNFRKTMYAIARRLPEFEKYGLAGQIRRAALSLTNNIAEGHGRFHYPDQIRFMLQARGSLQELIDDVNTCEDESYIRKDEISSLKEQGWTTAKILNGYMRWLRDRRAAKTPTLKESSIPYGDQEDLEVWLSGGDME